MSPIAKRPIWQGLSPRERRLLALGLAVAVGVLVCYLRLTTANAASDLHWPHCAAKEWLQGRDPYGDACLSYRPDGTVWVVNPFTTVLVMVPFSGLPLMTATALILGLTAGLLAYGLVQRGGPGMLVLFLSAPAVEVLKWGQWMYLIPAITLLPSLYLLTAVKPHVALPTVMTRISKRRLLGLAAFGLISLLMLPGWPLKWLALSTTYDGVIPFLSLSGLLFLPLAFLWRDSDARYLLLVAFAPQRGLYDAMLAVPALSSPLGALVWAFCTWPLMHMARALEADTVTFLNIVSYLPAVLLVILQAVRRRTSVVTAASEVGAAGGSAAGKIIL